LFYVLLQLLVVAAIILSFKFYCKFYCMFYFTCDRSLNVERAAESARMQDQLQQLRLSCSYHSFLSILTAATHSDVDHRATDNS